MTKHNGSYIEFALKLGLSPKAAAVYVALLSSKIPLSPKKLITETRLHRQYIYDALHELRAQGLVRPVGEGRKVQYAASSPEKTLTKMEEKRLLVLESIQNLLELYNERPASMIEIVEGPHTVVANELKILREQEVGASLDIIGGAGSRFLELFQEDFEEYEQLRAEKECKIRYIGATADTSHNENPLIKKRRNYEERHLSGLTDAINICIRPDSVTFNVFAPEVLTLRVKNPEAVASQRALFEVLWSVAK